MLGGVAESFVHSPIKTGPIAKKPRIHADRPRHPWRERFALRAGLYGAIEMFIAVVCANLNVLFSPGLETSPHWHDGDNGGQDFHCCSQCEPEYSIQIQRQKTATNLHKGDKGGQWSKAYAAGMRRPRLQGCIHADFTQRPPLLTGPRVFSHSTHLCKMECTLSTTKSAYAD
jgi:hypothetical protein